MSPIRQYNNVALEIMSTWFPSIMKFQGYYILYFCACSMYLPGSHESSVRVAALITFYTPLSLALQTVPERKPVDLSPGSHGGTLSSTAERA